MEMRFAPLDPWKALPLSGASFLTGAHHPHCDRYRHHLIWFLGHPLCLGCTCLYCGMLVGIPLTLAVDWSQVYLVSWVSVHLIALLPTALQPWCRRKSFKIVSRTILGICITSYFISGLLLLSPAMYPTLFRSAVPVAFIVGYKTLTALRNRRIDDPCETCPLGVFPTCEWNLPRLLAENSDPMLLEALTDVRGKLRAHIGSDAVYQGRPTSGAPR